MLKRLLPPDPRHIGREPDYRFTLANERTFLAWIRTSLALAAGGLGVASLLPDFRWSEPLGLLLLALSFTTAASSYRQWARNETAMRLGQPLSPSHLPAFMAGAVAIASLVTALLFVVDQI